MAAEKAAQHDVSTVSGPSRRSQWVSRLGTSPKAIIIGVLVGCVLGSWLPRLWTAPTWLPQFAPSRDNHLITACYPPLPGAYHEGISAEDIKREVDRDHHGPWTSPKNPYGLIEHGIRDGSLTSAAVTVFTIGDETDEGSGIVFDRGFGVQRGNESSSGPVDSNTIYRLASVTKVFTALQLLIQQKAGRVDLDADISTYLPRFHLNNESWSGRLGWTNDPRSSHASVTARQLISHFSGIQRDRLLDLKKWALLLTEEDIDEIEFPSSSVDGIYNQTSHNPYVLGPWTSPVYSNTGFNIAGLVAVAVDSNNNTYEDLLHKDVFQPLGMDSSSFALTTEDLRQRVAVPAAPFSVEADVDMGVENPSGAMYASARDLRRFVQSLLSPSAHNGALLSPDEVRRWLQPMHIFDDGRSGLGMPWEIVHVDLPSRPHDLWHRAPNRRSLTLYTKGGNLGGYHTMMVIEPQRKLGAIFLSTASQPVKQLEMPLEALQVAVDAWDRVREHRWRKLYTGHFGNCHGSNHVVISYESQALFIDEFVIQGKDMLHSFDIQDPVQHPYRRGKPIERLALWPTDEPGIFRLALGRGKPKPLSGCEEIWASWDGLPYSNGFPADLVALRNGSLHIPAANVTLHRH